MRLRHRLITCAVASLATLPCAVTALAQPTPEPSPTAQNRAEEQRYEAERRQLEAQQRQLEQQKERIEQQLRRAQEQVARAAQQAEQAGRRAAEQAEQAVRRGAEQAERAARRAAEQGQQLARRAQEQAQYQYRALRMGQFPSAQNTPPPGQPPQGGDFERELFRAQGLDTGGGQGDGGAPFLGVSTMPAPNSLRQRVELPPGIGLVVQSVEQGSPAEQAGVKQYDILHKLNDQLLVNMEQLSVLVRTFKPGEEVRLTVVRGGRAQELTARLGERREQPRETRRRPQPGQPNQPGPFVQPPATPRGGGGGFGQGFGNRFGGVAPRWPSQQPQQFWMPNPMRQGQGFNIQPVQPGQPNQPWQPMAPVPSPRRSNRAVPARPAAPVVAPVPTAPAAPPQIQVVPVPRAEPAPVIVATPVPAPQPYALPVPAPEPVQP